MDTQELMRGIRFLKENGQPDATKIMHEARARAARHMRAVALIPGSLFSSWSEKDWIKSCYSDVVAQAEGEQALWAQRKGHVTPVSSVEARELSTDGRL